MGNILKVKVNSTQRNKVLAVVRDFIARGCKFYIVTPNPEIVLKATKDEGLMSAINSSTLSLPDGTGLAMAHRFLRLKTPKNILLKIPVSFCQGIVVGLSLFINKNWLFSGFNVLQGRKVFLDLVSLANKKGWKIFLLGGGNGEAEKTGEKLKLSYKKVKIGYSPGPMLDNEAEPRSERDSNIQNDTVDRINDFKPHLLFVAFGAPKQEKWIERWLSKLDIGGAMVVGGAFSYIAGTSNLPPKWIENAGLEWTWRLITQPKRIKRIFNAVFVFPLMVFMDKIHRNN